MPWIAWLFIVLALAMIVGSLMLLRDTAHQMPISEEKMKRILARKQEMEARDREEER